MINRFKNHPYDYGLSCDLSDLPQASVVLVNIPKLLSRKEKMEVVLYLLKSRFSRQEWVAWSRESDVNYPMLKNKWFFLGV